MCPVLIGYKTDTTVKSKQSYLHRSSTETQKKTSRNEIIITESKMPRRYQSSPLLENFVWYSLDVVLYEIGVKVKSVLG